MGVITPPPPNHLWGVFNPLSKKKDFILKIFTSPKYKSLDAPAAKGVVLFTMIGDVYKISSIGVFLKIPGVSKLRSNQDRGK